MLHTFTMVSRKGSTLLELAIVVTSLFVIGLMVAPSILRSKAGTDLEIAAHSTRQALQLAAAFASAHKADSPWTLSLPDGIVFPGTNLAHAQEDPVQAPLIIRFYMPDGVGFVGAFTGVTFDIQGTPDKQGTITLYTYTGQSVDIEIGNADKVIIPTYP